MATCRECLHFKVCDSGRHIGEYIEDDGVYSEGVERECELFCRETVGVLAGKGVVYGETKFWHAKDGEVVEYTCIGYCEQRVWVHEDYGYRLARLIYGRNFKHASTAFMFAEHPTFLHTPTVGREVFFDKKEALAAAKAQRDAANLI